MDIRVQQSKQMSIVLIAGSLDALTAGRASECLTELISKGEKYLVLDLNKVDFMSSAGLRVILGALKACRQQGGDLSLAAAQPGVARVLKMSGFVNILNFYESADEAVEQFEDLT